MLMSIPGLFVVLLIVGLVTDELTLDDAILFVIAFLVCYIAIRLLHIEPSGSSCQRCFSTRFSS
jgi:hypothetical protein